MTADSPTNVVLVLNQFALPREQGGGTRHIDLFSRLQCWRAEIIAGNRNHYSQERYEAPAPFTLVRVPRAGEGMASRLLAWLSYCAQALAIGMCRRNVDVVYASSPHLLTPLVGAIVAAVRRIPLVLEIRDLWPESIVSAGAMRRGGRLHRALEALEGWLVRRAAHIVVVTPGWENHLMGLGADADAITVIPNGTELRDFDVPTAREELRREYGLDGFTAVFAGAHGPKDGLDYILDAAESLPGVQFVLVGAGPAKDGAIATARRRELKNVQFRDPVPKTTLPKLLRACDVGIHAVTPLPVFQRGMSPNKLFDYLAAGLPVVSNAGTALSAILADGEAGAVVEASGLTRGLLSVREASDDQRAQWARNGRQILLSRYSRSAAATALQSVLRTSMHTRSTAP